MKTANLNVCPSCSGETISFQWGDPGSSTTHHICQSCRDRANVRPLPEPGFETLCVAKSCLFNDYPLCKLNDASHPIKITEGGRCMNYELDAEKAVRE